MSDVDAAIRELKKKSTLFGCAVSDEQAKEFMAEMDAAENALRELLTPTISEADIEAGAVALWSSEFNPHSWDELSDAGQSEYFRIMRIVLEAVATARQRATGSGVSADE